MTQPKINHYDCIEEAINTGEPLFADTHHHKLYCGTHLNECPYYSKRVDAIIENHNTPNRFVTTKHRCNYQTQNAQEKQGE